MKPEITVITHPEDENLARPPSYANDNPVWIESFNAPFGSGGPFTTYLVVSKYADEDDLLALAERGRMSVETLRKFRDSLPARDLPYSDEGIEIVEIPFYKSSLHRG